ncbi:hypothetical protein [Streptomyces sp. NPDC057253]|uniref:hypothetical protein n=1 Tax=Streptomyces sp. NPDC057253 TaxID=3346069 RepID=UPI00363CCC22
MSTAPARPRTADIPGAKALWLLEHSAPGRLVHVRRETALVHPAPHLRELGRLPGRTPVQATVLPRTATYHAEEICLRPAPAGPSPSPDRST